MNQHFPEVIQKQSKFISSLSSSETHPKSRKYHPKSIPKQAIIMEKPSKISSSQYLELLSPAEPSRAHRKSEAAIFSAEGLGGGWHMLAHVL